jgi:hypothetical protein
MSKKPGNGKKPKPPQTGGFWDRSDPKPEVLSVRHSSSRLKRSIAFLRRIAGLGSKGD